MRHVVYLSVVASTVIAIHFTILYLFPVLEISKIQIPNGQWCTTGIPAKSLLKMMTAKMRWWVFEAKYLEKQL